MGAALMEFSKEWMRSPKERGEWAEARFLARAAEEGFRVSKPWGDSARYDFAVEREGRFLRIQVKSTVSRLRDGYRCLLQPPQAKENPKKLYTAEQVDFFAAYVIPEDVWYILPAEVAVKMRGRAWLFPGSPGHKYEGYKEAWELLRAAVSGAEAKVVEGDGEVEEDASGVGDEGLEMRGEVEAGAATGFDQNVVRGRMAECFARMRRR
jgi:hypothetical protein